MSVFIHDRVHGAAPGLKIKPLLELDSVINRSHTPVKYMYRHMKSPPTFLYLCGCLLSGRILRALLIFISMDVIILYL